MLKSGKKITPMEKRGGMRRPIKRRPKHAEENTPQSYFHLGKSQGLFGKRLGQYRFVICTDLETDDIVALTLFTAWVKANEKFFDGRNSFPIYGFVIGETHNKRVKAQRAREFLKMFGDILQWDDTEHHLYNGYHAAGSRVWLDGESDKSFDDEASLVENKEALQDENYPDPESFVHTIDDLMQIKASNLFILYLKPVRFFQSLANRPEVFNYLRNVPSAMYGSWNVRCVLQETPELKEPIMRFLNRTATDAPLVYTESFMAVGDANTMEPSNAPKLFRELDEAEDDELASLINKTMYAWNDNILNRQIGRLSKEPEFAETDFDDYTAFKADLEKLTPERAEELRYVTKIVGSILKSGSRQFVYADPLAIIGMLQAAGGAKNSPFRLQRSGLDYSGKFFERHDNSVSSTFVLLPKEKMGETHNKAAKRYLDRMLRAGFKITTEST